MPDDPKLTYNAYLSIVTFLKNQLDASSMWKKTDNQGRSREVAYANDWPEDDKIKLIDNKSTDPDEVEKEIILPAFNVQELPIQDGNIDGIGSNGVQTRLAYQVFLYGERKDQEIVLREFLRQLLDDGTIIPIYDYSDGYKAYEVGTVTANWMEVERVVSSPAHDKRNPNIALRYGGRISFTAVTSRTKQPVSF